MTGNALHADAMTAASATPLALVVAAAALLVVATARRLFGWRAAHAALAASAALAIASVDPTLGLALPLIAAANYRLGGSLRARGPGGRLTSGLLTAGVVANVAALLVLRAPMSGVGAIADGGQGSGLALLAPVGLALFALSQIGWLLDCAAGRTRPDNPERHAVFALTPAVFAAGAVLMQRDVADQLAAQAATGDRVLSPGRLAVCLTFAGVGLVKAVVIAGALSPYASVGLGEGGAVGAGTAWLGALAFTLRLYFTLSGAADVAIGVAFLFGLRTPLNFDAPLRATSMAGFWNRWMMSVTRFLATHLKGPLSLAGGRRATAAGLGPIGAWLLAGAAPLVVAFTVMGLWLGGGAPLLVFGALHGAALAVNHGWRRFALPSPGWLGGWALTTLVVVGAMALLRAPTLETALGQWAAMAGLREAGGGMLAGWPVSVDPAHGLAIVFAAWAFALAAPAAQSVMRAYWVGTDAPPPAGAGLLARLRWRPSTGWAAAAAAALLLAVTSADDPTLFLRGGF